MFYFLLKAYARLAIKVYCRRIRINKPEMLEWKGPLLLAANHPNSFLDGMILTTLFDHPVYSLARGDAFKGVFMNRLLRRLQLLPVYRTSEGVENLEHNYITFQACQEVFRRKAIVLIFSEGRCENEWHLRPLKKGTARLAIDSWNKGIPLQVVPLGYNYSSFKRFGKALHLYFGTPIPPSVLEGATSPGLQHQAFNKALESQLKELVYEIPEDDRPAIRKTFGIRKKASLALLALPALAGALAHAPLFLPVKLFTQARFARSGHYDSMQTSLLLLAYPLYLIAAAWVVYHYLGTAAAFGSLLALPFLAWACVQAKYQLDI
ncbi:MAG TPA: 1-acyl-sn-glycerol-3-phosphate acyltransferase [Flavisolibacter sp.]|nr:1-acyl-sn-glycerol-3-phosphate acyltransferase [Flavisolibacter sp.]